jgi:hypothetical protein
MTAHTTRRSFDRPTRSEAFDEAGPIIGAPAIYGPPVSFLLVPWLLLVLLLVPPFALLFTIVLVLAVAAVLLAALGAVLASPYLLVRHLHGHPVVLPRHLVHRIRTRPARTRVGSAGLASAHMKGTS